MDISSITDVYGPTLIALSEPKMVETPRNIHQRILEVMRKVDYIQKEKKKEMQYSIVSHDKVTALIRPHMVEAGITYAPVVIDRSQNGNRTEMTVIVRFTNADDPKDFFETASCGYGIDGQDKGPGKALSYAMKYALLKTFGLETGDDPDLEQEVKHVSVIPSLIQEAVQVSASEKPYASMSVDERIDLWANEWSKTNDLNVFNMSVARLRVAEPEGSPVRAGLTIAYKLALSRLQK